MTESGKVPDSVEQSFITVNDIEKDTRKSKLAGKPKVGGNILGDDGITGRIR